MKQEFAVVQFLKDAKRGSPVLWRSSVAMAIGMVLCFALPVIDARLIAGVSVWEKPAKFFLSLMVQAMTIAWAISLIPQYARRLKSATWIFVFAAWFEMSYMIFRASRGEASHFNQTSSLAIVMYALMGVGAVSLMVTSAFVGWRVWQQRGASLMREAIGLGLMFGAFLGTIAGAYLSSHTSHWIGGDQTDASGLAFFHWSTTGGDLRVAHFVGLHATQFVPLAALSGNRMVVYGMAGACVLLTVASFVMAVLALPILQL